MTIPIGESSGFLGETPETSFGYYPGLTSDQEDYLFGDPGELRNEELTDEVFTRKYAYAREWLASFWPQPLDEKVVADYEAEIGALRLDFPTAPETYGVEKPNPIAEKIRKEVIEDEGAPLHRSKWLLFDSVYGQATRFALENIGEDPDGVEKLTYVRQLFKEAHIQWQQSGRQGGNTRVTRIPRSIPSYRGTDRFPANDTGLLF